MASLGFSVPLLRILAFAYASFIAAVAGILVVWFNGQISPGTASVNAAIDILVIAVVGGLGHPIGPYIGALVFILLRTFAIDLFHLLGFTSLRFNLLVGVGFLAIVAFSPDGVIGLWQRWRGSILRPRR
jgi:branched-chain amino acid transport system permease protein